MNTSSDLQQVNYEFQKDVGAKREEYSVPKNTHRSVSMNLTPVETANKQDLQKPSKKSANPFNSQVSSKSGTQHLEGEHTPNGSKLEMTNTA